MQREINQGVTGFFAEANEPQSIEALGDRKIEVTIRLPLKMVETASGITNQYLGNKARWDIYHIILLSMSPDALRLLEQYEAR